MIEVNEIERSGDDLVIRGTAVAYEGNLRLELRSPHSDVPEEQHIQASAGGPFRGTWCVRVALGPTWTQLVLSPGLDDETSAEIQEAERVLLDRAAIVHGS